MPGTMDEHILQRRLADGNRLDLAGEGFHNISHKSVPLAAFKSDFAIEYAGLGVEPLLDAQGQRFGLRGFQDDHIATYLAPQIRRSSHGDDLAAIKDRQAIAAL